MAKKYNYKKKGYKAKYPTSIRYNVADFEAAIGLSGRSTVQELWDYLLAKYLSDMGKRDVAPIDKLDAGPIDPNILDVSKAVPLLDNAKLLLNKGFNGGVFSEVMPPEKQEVNPQKKEEKQKSKVGGYDRRVNKLGF